ncbi:MAG: DNA mismatch repair protein MutS, partial [Verrucomicrobiota bacterium]
MSDKTTPMMKQYRSIRNQLPVDTILFFRLGDFYEMFFEDAKEAARILEISLTKRHNTPMCGVPYHSAQGYLAKLIRAGKKVAICEQTEDPAEAKGIFKREVTRVITPGTVLEDNVLDSSRNNYLAGLYRNGSTFGLAWLDLSTGTFWMEEADSFNGVQDGLARQSPSECLVPEDLRDDPQFQDLQRLNHNTLLTPYDDWTFEYDAAVDTLTRHFKVHSLKGFGCENRHAGISAAGAVLHYVTHELHNQASHVRQIRYVNAGEHMILDEDTILNLDLVASRTPGRAAGAATLLRILDTTRTAMGGRMLRSWILRPLLNLKTITQRHDVVEAFTKDRTLLQNLRDELGEVKDLERLIVRLGSGHGNARDLRMVAQSLSALPRVKNHLAGTKVTLLKEIDQSVSPLPDLCRRIDEA